MNYERIRSGYNNSLTHKINNNTVNIIAINNNDNLTTTFNLDLKFSYVYYICHSPYDALICIENATTEQFVSLNSAVFTPTI